MITKSLFSLFVRHTYISCADPQHRLCVTIARVCECECAFIGAAWNPFEIHASLQVKQERVGGRPECGGRLAYVSLCSVACSPGPLDQTWSPISNLSTANLIYVIESNRIIQFTLSIIIFLRYTSFKIFHGIRGEGERKATTREGKRHCFE